MLVRRWLVRPVLLLLLVTGAVLLQQPRLFGGGACDGFVPPICRITTGGPSPGIDYFPPQAM